MHALARQRVEIAGERRHQRLAFAGAHFGDGAFVQHHAAEQLHIEMALAQRPLGGFAHQGKGRGEQVIDAFARRQFRPEGIGAGPQFRIRQVNEAGFQRVDGRDLGRIALQAAIIGGAENFLGERAEHAKKTFQGRKACAKRQRRATLRCPPDLCER